MSRSRKKNVTFIEHEASIKRNKIIKKVEKLIKFAGSILLLFFSWLTLKDFPILSLINGDTSKILMKISLVLYYSSWIIGTTNDLNDEDYTLIVAPNNGKLTTMAVSIIFMMGALFGILCWADNFKIFSLSLFAFFTVDYWGNIYLNNFIKNAFEESEIKYLSSKNYFGYESLQIIKHFLSGSFVKWRYLVGYILILIIIILSFTNLSSLIAGIFNIDKQIILSLTFMVFVVTIEIWMWYNRLKRKLHLSILDEMETEYILDKK